jgi:CelD/BcsL family acetyltransferase involved in cellulose biosynthesis
MQQIVLENAVNDEKTQPDQRVDLQIVEGAEGISEFGEHWDDLFARAVDAPPFLSRPWVSTFVREGRIQGTPLFVLVWHEAKLVALFPLAASKCLNARVAVPIGTGQGSYLGLLLDPNHRLVTERIADVIVSKKIFDVYYSTDLYSADLATNDLLVKLAKKGYSCRRVYRDPCPFIRLGCSYEEYLKTAKSAKSRQTLRRKERQLLKKHAVNVEYYNGSEVTADIIDRIASIQQASWMDRRGAAVLGQPFYRTLLLAMAQAGLAQVWLMTVDDDDVAFVFALVAHKKLYYAWTAFKLDHVSSLSVGQFLTNWTIRDACRDGILLYDFEHGDAEYKRFWSTDNHGVYRVVTGRGPWGRLLTIGYFVLWRLARIGWLRSSYHRMKRILRRFKQDKTRT